MQEFYYLDGKEQKGPLTFDELKSVGLKPDTFVWTERLDNWKPAKEVDELTILLRKTPPPPPIIEADISLSTIEVKEIENNTVIAESSNEKIGTTLIILISIFVLIGVVALIVHYAQLKQMTMTFQPDGKVQIMLAGNGKATIDATVETLTLGAAANVTVSATGNILDDFNIPSAFVGIFDSTAKRLTASVGNINGKVDLYD